MPPSLSWDFSDADTDPSGGYEVQVASDVGFSTIATSSGTVDSIQRNWRAPALADGVYYWRVRSRDPFGVWSEWSAGTRFGVDTTAPIAVARRGGVLVGSPVLVLHPGDLVELNATDVGSGVARIEVSLDGGTWTTYSSPVPFDAVGRHFLAFRAFDNAGNVGPTNVLVVDTVPPFNWTPFLALALGVVIAGLGAAIARRNKRRPVALTWGILSAPATVVEIVIGIYSLATGELTIPPWSGAGLLSVATVGAAGFAAIVIGSKALAVREAPPA